MSSINNITSGYLQSILTSALQNTGGTKSTGSTSQVTQQGDNSNLSPFAQLMSTLQQLEQSDPSKYQQVTQQIASNLQSAAQTAQSQGNTTAASQLNQLAQDFTNASQSGQLPNVSDLAKAAHGHHHHHHFHDASSDSDTNTSTDSNSSSATSSLLSQLPSTNGTQSDSLNPMNIILNTLSKAGVTNSNS